jgi:hypothetical protein
MDALRAAHMRGAGSGINNIQSNINKYANLHVSIDNPNK